MKRYPPQNISNPFPGVHQPGPHQNSHLQHPNPSLQGAHNFGGHHAFASAQNNTIFGPQGGANGANAGAAGNLHTGFVAGAALGGQAQMGFTHGAVGLQQQLQQVHETNASAVARGQQQRIREVWKHNLAEEMALLRALVEKYPYISMDTEFPGVVARPIAEDFGSKSAYHYQTMRANVDLLKLIQLGITLFTFEGDTPPPNALDVVPRNAIPGSATICPCTWTFNFKFSLEEDMYNESSINLLKSAGADLEKHAAQGIEAEDFGSLLITSGLTFNKDVSWLSFHGGYDFGYLIKVMWCRGLPQDEEHYRRLLKKFFPNIYDVKYILMHARKLRDRGTVTAQTAKALEAFGTKTGLQDIADELGLTRIGMNHTAGSDSWLTGDLYFELRRRLYDNSMPAEFNGEMWGLTGIGPPASATAQAAALAGLQQSQNHPQGNNTGANGGLYHGGAGQQHHREAGGPSTPNTNPAGLAGTPSQYGNMGTPGNGAAVFGNFQYGK